MSGLFRFPATATVAAALLLSSCSGQAPRQQPPPEVSVVTVKAGPVANIVELPGRVEAYRTSEVRARVDGIVQARLYEEGSDVPAGKALFQIDPRQLRASENAVQAQLARAQATAANATQDVQRYSGLIADQAISKQEYDAALARQRTAQADVAQARAQLDAAKLSLGYATVTAPIAGRVSRAQVTEGALVSAASGTLLTKIEQIDRVYVNFSQSSADLLAIRRDIASGKLAVPTVGRVPVRLMLEDGGAYPTVGHLDFFDLSINEATGTAALRAEFANPEMLLLPGQFVRARIVVGTRANGIRVPQRAVQLAADGGSVLVVGPKSVVEARRVKLGQLDGGQWDILDGLKPGEQVIVDGLQMAQPGKPVRIGQAKAAAAPPAKR